MSKLRRTLSRKLSLRIMLLAIPIFVVSLSIFYNHSNALIDKEAVERSATILNATMQKVENFISTIETAAKSNVWLLEENFNPESLEAISRRIVNLNKSVLSCSISTEPDVFPEYGRYFSVYSVNEGDSVITMLEPEFEYFEKNWYKKPMQTGRPCWINPFSDFNQGTINHHDAVGSFCIPLRPNGGRIMGVVSADFSFKTLQETILATEHPYPDSYYMLLGPAGGYLIHPESSLLFKKTIFSATDSIEHPDVMALGRAMTGGKEGTMHVNFNGERCHVCYAPVPGTGWSLALVTPDDEVLANYRHLMMIMVAIILLGLVLIWWLTSIVVRQNIQPIYQLLEATNKIADGDYSEVIPHTDRRDVISQLQNAFRRMQQSILKHTESIRQTSEDINKQNAELEKATERGQEAAKRKKIFVQNVSRQVSTPLNVIDGLATVLLGIVANKEKKPDPEKVQLETEEIRNITFTMKHNAVRLHRRTLMLYDSSETGNADPSKYKRTNTVLCNEVARECIKLTEELYKYQNIHFETELPDNFSILTNRHFAELTLRELLYNSFHHTNGDNVTLRITKTETTVRFTVEDMGPGLPENLQDLIFEPFMKVDDLNAGLGLGLPLCKRHATALEGDLIYDSTYKQGCRFILELPL